MAENANPRERLLKARTLLKAALGGAYDAIESEAATAGTVAMALAALSQAHQAWNDAIVAIPIDAMLGVPEMTPLDLPQPAPEIPLELGTDGREWASAFLFANKNTALSFGAVAAWFTRAIECGLLAEMPGR